MTVIEGDQTLQFLDEFVAAGSGGLTRPRGVHFGPDRDGDGYPDHLYVVSADTNQILRYDSRTRGIL